MPLGGSPQKCTERKGQLSKALSVLSLGLGYNQGYIYIRYALLYPSLFNFYLNVLGANLS